MLNSKLQDENRQHAACAEDFDQLARYSSRSAAEVNEMGVGLRRRR